MNFKYYKTEYLIPTVLVVLTIIEYILGTWVSPILQDVVVIGISLTAPASMSILGILFIAYDKYLWKLPGFNFLMTVPNMSGRYKGQILFEFGGTKKEKPCFIEITQSSSKIKVDIYFSDGKDENTSSKSLVEDIKLEENGFYDIYLFYLNGGSKQNGGLDCHEGANKFRFLPGKNGKNKKLLGHYFTNRQIQTRGEIEGEWESNILEGKF